MTKAPTSYDTSFCERLFAIEDRHFWFRARNQAIGKLTRQVVAELPHKYHVLEIGCGTGNVLRELGRVCMKATVIGMDLFMEGLSFAKRRVNGPLVQGDIYAVPFKAKFDLVVLADVLEHLPNDEQVLRNIYNLLILNGRLLLTVPAHPSLWSYFDLASHHCRRYVVGDLEQKLQRAGFTVEYSTQLMAILGPLLWVTRRFRPAPDLLASGGAERVRALASRELRIIPGLNALLAWLLHQETRLIARRIRIPTGTSLLVIARKQ